ncbi:MAG: hypothetical protein ACRD8O_20115 [Bryobacteraceae bacterium]
MRRFEGHKPPVREVSASIVAEVGVRGRNTGEIGLLFTAAGIKWISRSEAQVKGGYYEAELSSSGNTYTVRKQNGKWKVTHDRLHSIALSQPTCSRLISNLTYS